MSSVIAVFTVRVMDPSVCSPIDFEVVLLDVIDTIVLSSTCWLQAMRGFVGDCIAGNLDVLSNMKLISSKSVY